jgi:putative ABC transport system substrate-binding protein
VAASTVGRAHAQQNTKVYRIAIVSPASPVSEMNEANAMYGPFLDEFRRRGYVEGQNVVIERFSGEGRAEHYREMLSNVVRSRPDAIIAFQNQLALDLKAQTTTIPLVVGIVDPVGFGVVPNLAHPGGNITGVDGDTGLQLWGKRLALLKEAVPKIARMGLLIVPNELGKRGAAAVKEAAEKIDVALFDSQLTTPLDAAAYRRAFAAMVEERVEAVYVGSHYENWTNRRVIVSLTEHHRLPAVYGNDGFVEIGGLMAYQPDWADVRRHAADAVAEILKGTKPGDIPFYQARKFDLAINLKTAKALGIEIPNSILAQADKVIE